LTNSTAKPTITRKSRSIDTLDRADVPPSFLVSKFEQSFQDQVFDWRT
jgi:hypothetical protein